MVLPSFYSIVSLFLCWKSCMPIDPIAIMILKSLRIRFRLARAYFISRSFHLFKRGTPLAACFWSPDKVQIFQVQLASSVLLTLAISHPGSIPSRHEPAGQHARHACRHNGTFCSGGHAGPDFAEPAIRPNVFWGLFAKLKFFTAVIHICQVYVSNVFPYVMS